jgi:DNA-binding XRE family transcriptional regulator
MPDNWSELVRRYRLRHALTQGRMAALLGVSQRTISRWERGQDKPSLALQRHLRDLSWELPGHLLGSLAASIEHCPFPRALSRTPRMRLQALSGPALKKRPSAAGLVGRDLAPMACGILQEMLDDQALQVSIAAREVSCVVATTRSVLRTREHRRIGAHRTVITYFFHEGTLYSDAISAAAPKGATLGYKAIAMDEVLGERD